MFILGCKIVCIVFQLLGIAVFIILYLKLRHRSCKNCRHYKGEKCDIITWEDINNLNQRHACGFFEEKHKNN